MSIFPPGRRQIQPGFSRVKPMSGEAIALKEESGQVRRIEPVARSSGDMPAIQALTQVERDVWIRVSRGDRQRDIAGDLQLDRSTVTKVVSAVREKIHFLVRLREILVSRRVSTVRRFLGCEIPGRCPCILNCRLRPAPEKLEAPLPGPRRFVWWFR
jgi:DNA-binding CsgD family transcriptional regulator